MPNDYSYAEIRDRPVRLAQPPAGTRLVLVAENLLETTGTRAADGRLLSFEWGEPDANGWYTPTITATDDDWLADALAAARSDERARLRNQVRALRMAETDVGTLNVAVDDPDSGIAGWNAAVDSIVGVLEGAT